MKFKSNSRKPAREYEQEIAKFWREHHIFEKSVARNPAENTYVFYDGPPFITGVPHHGTLLSSIVKDAVPRYWTMKGKRVERRWGWDCHGLPAENFVEKELGITDRRQIITDKNQPAPRDKNGETLPTITLENYIKKARESMVANSETWEPIIERVGRWVDFRGAYRTMDKNFMESVWWAFKKLFDAGKIYEGEKVLMYDTRFATPVSKAEVTMDNDAYQTVSDPSVYVKFRALRENGKPVEKNGLPLYFLAWTTTPWTLPGNTALAVNPKMNYSEVKIGEEILVVARDLRDKVFASEGEFEVIEDVISGAKLVGKNYAPIFDFNENSQKNAENNSQNSAEISRENFEKNLAKNSNKIWSADYVSAESGTGIVHLAPIYGEEDFELAVREKIPRKHVLDDNGFYYEKISRNLTELFANSFGENYAEILKKSDVKIDENGNYEVWSVNKMIAKALKIAGIVWKIETIRHEYPFNPRSKQRIMYRAIPSWFFDVQNSKSLMLEQNENINWFPPHLKHGRFAKNIEQAPDWNLSRDRFWATAMPVWKGDKGSIHVVGSYEELFELSGEKLADYHRPWVDKITFETDKIPEKIREKYHFNGKSGEKFARIDKVLDCWFESGSMPFAQFHYPFENREKFEQNYPGDFISEYMPQVRAWFYYVHTVNTSLANCGAFGENCQKRGAENPFNNVIVSGTLAGNDGRKMSKSLGNFTDPTELMDEFSADSLRFLLLSSPLLSGEDFSLKDKDVSDISRKLSMIWNMFDFFTMYAEVDGWEFAPSKVSRHYEITQKIVAKKLPKNAKILFVCYANFARSQMAKAIYNHLTNSENAASAGFMPELAKENGQTIREREIAKNLEISPARKQILDNYGVDFANSPRQFLTPELANDYDLIVNLTEKWETPEWLENRENAVRWSVKNPESLGKNGDEKAAFARAEIDRRIRELIAGKIENDEVRETASPTLKMDLAKLQNPLDIWIISRLSELCENITREMDNYNLPDAMSAILPFVDDASNWFVRRSRRRFWKSSNDNDKNEAYETLHFILTNLAILLAPFTPFLAEELFAKLTGGILGESVHLLDWPNEFPRNKEVLEDMKLTRSIINSTLRERMSEPKIKIRQPLSKLEYFITPLDKNSKYKDWAHVSLNPFYEEIIAEETNVKKVAANSFSGSVGLYGDTGDEYNYQPQYLFDVRLNKTLTPELKREGLAREIIRAVQNARKSAGLNVDDRIILELKTADENLQKSIAEFREIIAAETLATDMFDIENGYQTVAKIDSATLEIQIQKAEN